MTDEEMEKASEKKMNRFCLMMYMFVTIAPIVILIIASVLARG